MLLGLFGFAVSQGTEVTEANGPVAPFGFVTLKVFSPFCPVCPLEVPSGF